MNASLNSDRIFESLIEQQNLVHELGKMARRAFMSALERGFVWLEFASQAEAVEFLFRQRKELQVKNKYLAYFSEYILAKYCAIENRVRILQTNREQPYSSEQLEQLHSLCKCYSPLDEFVLLMSIKSHNYGAFNINRFFKLKLINKDYSCKSLTTGQSEIKNSASHGYLPTTLVLTPLINPIGKKRQHLGKTNREIFFANVVSELSSRGIELRSSYPKLYDSLCIYVEKGRPFAPVCLYPRNKISQVAFMCLILPSSEPALYSWLYDDLTLHARF
jgi:hypothetical protein